LSTKTVDGKVTVRTFINALNDIVVTDGIANKEHIDALYKTGFVSNLGHWLGAYDKIKTDQMCSGMDGTKLYNVSQNNSITNTVENLNSHDEQNPLIQTLTGYSYNRSSMNGFPIGSRLLRMIEDNTLPHMVVKTPIGFRTDSYGDTGAKYSELQEAEDYINKFAMLQNGFLVLPTLADKGTYMVIQFG
jgi:hypothetical protein